MRFSVYTDANKHKLIMSCDWLSQEQELAHKYIPQSELIINSPVKSSDKNHINLFDG